jgi:hypothetical protein
MISMILYQPLDIISVCHVVNRDILEQSEHKIGDADSNILAIIISDSTGIRDSFHPCVEASPLAISRTLQINCLYFTACF